MLYEINRKKCRYSLLRDYQMPLNIQTLNCCKGNMIAIGTYSNFVVYHINNRDQAPLCNYLFNCLIIFTYKCLINVLLDLVNQDCNELSYIIQNQIDALTCQPIGEKEWLLVFAREYHKNFSNLIN